MPTFYHVTDRENVEPILRDGLLGGWGDDGFGIYLYSDLYDARSYAAGNGWDGDLQDPVILEIEADNGEVYPITVDPGWPNPEDYENVHVREMDPDDAGAWKPLRISLLKNSPSPEI